MQVSDLFIRRPVFAVVVSLLLIVGGLAALMNLPVREYPSVDKPIVSVSTDLSRRVQRGHRKPRHRSHRRRGGGHRGHQPDQLAEPERSLVRLDRVRRGAQPGSRDLGRARRGVPRGRPPARRRRTAGDPQGRRQRIRHHVGDGHLGHLRRARTQRFPQARLRGQALHRRRRRQCLSRRRATLRHARSGSTARRSPRAA